MQLDGGATQCVMVIPNHNNKSMGESSLNLCFRVEALILIEVRSPSTKNLENCLENNDN